MPNAAAPCRQNGKLPDADASDAIRVQVQFDAQNATGFCLRCRQQAPTGCSTRTASPQLDANNGQQADFDNLLILFSASTLRDDGVTLDYDLTMGGGVWLNGGPSVDPDLDAGQRDSTFVLV